jgi:hypothetical protein
MNIYEQSAASCQETALLFMRMLYSSTFIGIQDPEAGCQKQDAN